MVALIALASAAAEPSPWDDVLETPTRDRPADDALPPSGFAVRPIGGPAATSFGLLAVVGGSGGTQVGTISARAPVGAWQIGARLPFAAWRAPVTHETGLGNLGIEIDRVMARGSLGLEVVAHVGAPAWTWGYEATDAWPTTGAAVSYQSPVPVGAGAIVLRWAFGVFGTPDVAPVPGVYGRLHLAAAGDHPIGERVALQWETGFAWYDPSPLDAVLAVRVDPGDKARLRSGFVLPLAIWGGAGADQRTEGLTEIGWVTDLTLGF